MSRAKAIPRASLVLLTFNQQQFVEDALRAALAQDVDGLEVVVSDDASTDETWPKICSSGPASAGRHSIVLNRNAQRLGIVGNLMRAAEIASSDHIIVAHGDDISLPSRCSRTLEFWRSHGSRHELVAADAFDMSLDGQVIGIKSVDNLERWTPERWLRRRPFVLGAGFMVLRSFLLGRALRSDLAVEDQVLALRALMRSSAIRLPEPLICHRRGGQSQSRSIERAAKRRALLRSAQAGNLELEQMRLDGLELDWGSDFDRGLQRQVAVNSYIIEMLGGGAPFGRRLLRMLCARVPVAKRFRFFAWSLVGSESSAQS